MDQTSDRWGDETLRELTSTLRFEWRAGRPRAGTSCSARDRLRRCRYGLAFVAATATSPLALRSKPNPASTSAPAARRRCADGELALQLFVALGADALDVLQLLDRLERAVRLPVIDDRLRLGRSDAWQGNELVLRRGVEVDGGERDARAQASASADSRCRMVFSFAMVGRAADRGSRQSRANPPPYGGRRYAADAGVEISRST